jgi:hypothetical membrane protein
MSLERKLKTANRPMLVTGVLMIVASIAAAAWTLSIGDVVTTLGFGLLVIAGLLLAGIGLSSGRPTH